MGTSSGCSSPLKSSLGLSLSFSRRLSLLLLLAFLPGVFCGEETDDSPAFFTHRGREFYRFSQPSSEGSLVLSETGDYSGTERHLFEESESSEAKKESFSFSPSPEYRAAPATIMVTPESSLAATREKVLSSSSPPAPPASLASSTLPFLMLRGAPIGRQSSEERVLNKKDEELPAKGSPVKMTSASADVQTKKEEEDERKGKKEDIGREEIDSSVPQEEKQKKDEEEHEGTEADKERSEARTAHSRKEKMMKEPRKKEREKTSNTATSSPPPSLSLAPSSASSSSSEDEQSVSQNVPDSHEDNEDSREDTNRKYSHLLQNSSLFQNSPPFLQNPSLLHLLSKKRRDQEEQEQEGEGEKQAKEDQEGRSEEEAVIDDDLAGGQQSLSTFKITDPRVLTDLFKETPPEIEGRKTGVLAGSLAVVSLLAALSKKLPSGNPLGRLGGKVRDYTFLGTSGGFTAALILEALVSYYLYRVTKQRQVDYFKALKQIDKLYKKQKQEDLYLSPKNGDEKSDKNNSKKKSDLDSLHNNGEKKTPDPSPAVGGERQLFQRHSSLSSLRSLSTLLSDSGAMLPLSSSSLTKQQRHMKAQEKLLEALAIKHEPELYGLTPLIFFGVPLVYQGIFGRKKKEEESGKSMSALSSSVFSSSSLLRGGPGEDETRKKGSEYGRFIQGGIAVASALTFAWSCYKKWKYRKELAQLREKLSSLRSAKESRIQTGNKEGEKEREEKEQ